VLAAARRLAVGELADLDDGAGAPLPLKAELLSRAHL